MSIRILILATLLCTLSHRGYTQNTDEIVIGSKHPIHSEILNETQEFWVSLPASYDQEPQQGTTYPVLIVLDGRSLFRPISSMLSFMSTKHTESRQVPEMIVVGISSTNRERDFTPDKVITRRQNDTGGGDQFLGFLEKELLPAIHETYRTSPFNVLVGHSLGGLLASHAYMKAETAFSAFIAIDPSFGTWDAATMDEKVDAMTDASFDRFLYIATANWGKRNIRNRDRHVRFYEALNQRSSTDPFRAKLDYFKNENHKSVPLIAFYNGISAIFERSETTQN